MSSAPCKSLFKFNWFLKEISLGSCREDLETSWAQFQLDPYSNSINFSRKPVSATVEEIWKCFSSVRCKSLSKFISEGNQSRQLQRRSGSFLSSVSIKSISIEQSVWAALEKIWKLPEFNSNQILTPNLIDFERKSVTAAGEEILKCLSSVPCNSLFNFNCFLKENGLGSCRGDLEDP